MEKVDFTSTAESFQSLIDSLPDERPPDRDTRTCRCGDCDGYGLMVDSRGKARRCKAHFEQTVGPTLSTLRSTKGFIETPSFLAVESLREDLLADKSPRALFLYGGHGRSKTEASMALINEALLNGIKAHYAVFGALVTARKSGFDGNSEIKYHFNRIERSRLVVIDEFGREEQGGNADISRVLLTKIVQICEKQRFVIFASNLSRLELAKYLDSYMKSRLAEKAGWCSGIEDLSKQDLRLDGF